MALFIRRCGAEEIQVFVSFENRLATIPAGYQIINRYGILVTQQSWDESSKGESGSVIKLVLLKCGTIMMAIPDARS